MPLVVCRHVALAHKSMLVISFKSCLQIFAVIEKADRPSTAEKATCRRVVVSP